MCDADCRSESDQRQVGTPTDDSQLINAVRSGDISAFAQLYQRYVKVAYTAARQLARSSVEADDLVADTFHALLVVLLSRRGPDSAFRAYLLTALRHRFADLRRKDSKIDPVADVTSVLDSVPVSASRQDFATTVEHALVTAAFRRLPEHWRLVLWYRDIEARSPAEIATLLGLTANGVSALTYRAREGLRQAYLQEHVAPAHAEQCKPTIDMLGAWTRHGLRRRAALQVEEHLATCGPCRSLAIELADISSTFRSSRNRGSTRSEPRTKRTIGIAKQEQINGTSYAELSRRPQ